MQLSSQNQVYKNEVYQQLCDVKPDNVVPFDSNQDRLEVSLSLNIFLEDKIISNIEGFICELKDIEPNHFYYEGDKLHITLLGKIPPWINTNENIEKIENLLNKYSFKFQLLGVGSSKLVSSISAYPLNFDLFKFRNELRELLGVQGDDYSIHLNTYNYIGWINYMRYTHKPSQKFLETLKSKTDKDFGILEPKIIKLIKTESKTLKKNKTEVIHEF